MKVRVNVCVLYVCIHDTVLRVSSSSNCAILAHTNSYNFELESIKLVHITILMPIQTIHIQTKMHTSKFPFISKQFQLNFKTIDNNKNYLNKFIIISKNKNISGPFCLCKYNKALINK